MANRHVMIPEDIWRGLLLQNKSAGSNSPQTGDINLDYSRRSLDATRKNIPYNQQLRRYLHLRKQYENRPVKVEVISGPNAAIPIRNNAMPSASMLSGLNNDDGYDGGDDQWIDDNMSFLSLNNSLPSQVAPPSSPPRPVSRQLTKRRVSDNDDDAQSTGPSGPKKAKIQQLRPPQIRRRRQQKQRKPKQKRQKKQQQQQQNIQAQNLQETLRSDLPDEDADPGPSTSAAAYRPPQPILPPPPTRKGIKRRPLLSMRPPLFLHPHKRQKPNPPNPRKRAEPLAVPPPRKQFRPSLW